MHAQNALINLKNKCVLVTGAGRGIGRVFAQALAAAGAMVVVAGRCKADLDETVKMIQVADGLAVALVLDVTDDAAIKKSIAYIEQHIGAIAVLVNNAGYGGPTDNFWKASDVDWWYTFEVNLRGPFLCSYAVLPAMIARGAGCIINVVSNAGAFRWPGASAYSTSKAALIKMTENFSMEAKKTGVSMMAYHPGFMALGMVSNLLAIVDPDPGEAQVIAWMKGEIAAGRTVTSEQTIVNFMALVSGHYDALTGRYITAEDDLDVMLNQIKDDKSANLYMLRVRQP